MIQFLILYTKTNIPRKATSHISYIVSGIMYIRGGYYGSKATDYRYASHVIRTTDKRFIDYREDVSTSTNYIILKRTRGVAKEVCL